MKRFLFAVFALAAICSTALADTGSGFYPAPASGNFKMQCSFHVDSTNTGTTGYVTLATCTIPANTVKAGSTIRTESVWSITNNSNNHLVGVGIDAQATGGIGWTYVSNNLSFIMTRSCWIRDMNTVVYDKGTSSGYGNGGTAYSVSTYAIDWTQEHYIIFYSNLAVGTDTITLNVADVYIISP